MSPGVLMFMKDLVHITVGYTFSAICVFTFQVMAGRVLGPTEYGKYVLVDSVAMFLHIFMILGFSTAAIKYNAERNDYQRQSKIVSTSYLMVLVLSLIVGLFCFAFSFQFSNLFSISTIIFRLSIIFAFFYTLYILSTDTLQGLHEMKKLAIFRVGYGPLILAAFSTFVFNRYISFRAPVYSLGFAYLFFALIITINLRKYLSFQFDKFWTNKFFKYGIYASIGSVCSVFLPIFNKIIINKFLATADVGIYNAYFFASLAIVIFLFNTFTTVFFPTASKYQQKALISKRIKQFLPYLFLIGIPAFWVIEQIVLRLYGVEYPINYLLMLLFAFTSILLVVQGLYNWLFFSEGISGVKLGTAVAMVMVVINILLSLYLVPRLALYGAIISLGLAYFIGVICLLLLENKFYQHNG